MAMRFPKGQIAMPFILLVSGIIIEVAIAGSFVAFFISSSGLGERLSVRAGAAANAGISDALIRIARNKEYASTAQSYTLTVGSDSVLVSVSRTSDSSLNIYTYTITATATAGSRQEKIRAVALVDQTTGQLRIQSMVKEAI